MRAGPDPTVKSQWTCSSPTVERTASEPTNVATDDVVGPLTEYVAMGRLSAVPRCVLGSLKVTAPPSRYRARSS